jgi:hypothetical protein
MSDEVPGSSADGVWSVDEGGDEEGSDSDDAESGNEEMPDLADRSESEPDDDMDIGADGAAAVPVTQEARDLRVLQALKNKGPAEEFSRSSFAFALQLSDTDVVGCLTRHGLAKCILNDSTLCNQLPLVLDEILTKLQVPADDGDWGEVCLGRKGGWVSIKTITGKRIIRGTVQARVRLHHSKTDRWVDASDEMLNVQALYRVSELDCFEDAKRKPFSGLRKDSNVETVLK